MSEKKIEAKKLLPPLVDVGLLGLLERIAALDPDELAELESFIHAALLAVAMREFRVGHTKPEGAP